MDLAQVRALDSPEARRLLATLPPYDPQTALSLTEQLRREHHPAELVSALLTQSRLRTRARERWGDVVDQLVLTPDGAEQATRPQVAALRANRFAQAGARSIVDLGCGIGLDALAFASRGLSVRAYEQDPTTAAAAELNARSHGLNELVHVECHDVTSLDVAELLAGADGAFADPARRSGGRRLSRPDQWSPSLNWVLELPIRTLGVKVAPGLAHHAVPDDCEFEVVSVAGDVVEAGLYRGAVRGQDVRCRATLLPSGTSVTDADISDVAPPVGQVGRFLLEPDGAVIRAGLVATVVERVNGRLLDPTIAYVTTDDDVPSALATRYRVTDVLGFNIKVLRSLLRDRGVGRVTVKKRGFAAQPEEIRRQLRLDRSQPHDATVVLTRARGVPLAILVEPDR